MPFLPERPLIVDLDRANPITRGLTFAVPFDEYGGNRPYDYVGGRLGVTTGAITNGLVKSIRCKKIDSASSYISFGNDPQLKPAGSFSIMAWHMATQQNDYGYFIGDWTEAQNQSSVSFRDYAGRWQFFTYNNGYDPALSPNTIAFNAWYCLVGTYRESDKMQRLYENGKQVVATISSVTRPAGGNLVFGNWKANPGATLGDTNSRTAQLAYWSRVLAPQEVRWLSDNPWGLYTTGSVAHILRAGAGGGAEGQPARRRFAGSHLGERGPLFGRGW